LIVIILTRKELTIISILAVSVFFTITANLSASLTYSILASIAISLSYGRLLDYTRSAEIEPVGLIYETAELFHNEITDKGVVYGYYNQRNPSYYINDIENTHHIFHK